MENGKNLFAHFTKLTVSGVVAAGIIAIPMLASAEDTAPAKDEAPTEKSCTGDKKCSKAGEDKSAPDAQDEGEGDGDEVPSEVDE